MSDITIKATVQAGLNQTRNVDSRDQKANGNSQAVQKNTTPTDTVNLTSSTHVQALQEALLEAPVVDQQKVDALRAAIAEGTYSVDADDVAQNMIGFETNLR